MPIFTPFWGWSRFDWRNHHLHIDPRRFNAINPHHAPVTDSTWHFDPSHRHDVRAKRLRRSHAPRHSGHRNAFLPRLALPPRRKIRVTAGSSQMFSATATAPHPPPALSSLAPVPAATAPVTAPPGRPADARRDFSERTRQPEARQPNAPVTVVPAVPPSAAPPSAAEAQRFTGAGARRQ